jgi:hypothetical protein
MAKDDGPSKMGEIQQRLGVNGNYASQYRLRLIAAELIESSVAATWTSRCRICGSTSERKRPPSSEIDRSGLSVQVSESVRRVRTDST